jgi:uncharacterized membrane protein YeaQ/YmgE (transglycosylase-associated protein family)
MSILWMLFIGFIVGLIARFLMPGNDPMGSIMTIALGIAGSFLAGFVGQAIGLYRMGEPVGFLMSVLGAMIVLLGYRQFSHRRI